VLLGRVGDHILQEFSTLYVTRFRTYKIAYPPPPQDKNLEGEGAWNTCRKVLLQVTKKFCFAFYEFFRSSRFAYSR